MSFGPKPNIVRRPSLSTNSSSSVSSSTHSLFQRKGSIGQSVQEKRLNTIATTSKTTGSNLLNLVWRRKNSISSDASASGSKSQSTTLRTSTRKPLLTLPNTSSSTSSVVRAANLTHTNQETQNERERRRRRSESIVEIDDDFQNENYIKSNSEEVENSLTADDIQSLSVKLLQTRFAFNQLSNHVTLRHKSMRREATQLLTSMSSIQQKVNTFQQLLSKLKLIDSFASTRAFQNKSLKQFNSVAVETLRNVQKTFLHLKKTQNNLQVIQPSFEMEPSSLDLKALEEVLHQSYLSLKNRKSEQDPFSGDKTSEIRTLSDAITHSINCVNERTEVWRDSLKELSNDYLLETSICCLHKSNTLLATSTTTVDTSKMNVDIFKI